MITAINIFFNTKKTFKVLYDKSEESLDINSTLIFIAVGLLSATNTFFKEDISQLGVKWIVLTFLFGAGAGLVLGKFVASYLFFWIGKLLKGDSEIIDIRVVLAYALLPRLLEFPIIILLGINDNWIFSDSSLHYIIYSVYLVFAFFLYKILIQGLIEYNKYGFVKALINISPFLIFSIAFYIKGFLS